MTSLYPCAEKSGASSPLAISVAVSDSFTNGSAIAFPNMNEPIIPNAKKPTVKVIITIKNVYFTVTEGVVTVSTPTKTAPYSALSAILNTMCVLILSETSGTEPVSPRSCMGVDSPFMKDSSSYSPPASDARRIYSNLSSVPMLCNIQLRLP